MAKRFSVQLIILTGVALVSGQSTSTNTVGSTAISVTTTEVIVDILSIASTTTIQTAAADSTETTTHTTTITSTTSTQTTAEDSTETPTDSITINSTTTLQTTAEDSTETTTDSTTIISTTSTQTTAEDSTVTPTDSTTITSTTSTQTTAEDSTETPTDSTTITSTTSTQTTAEDSTETPTDSTNITSTTSTQTTAEDSTVTPTDSTTITSTTSTQTTAEDSTETPTDSTTITSTTSTQTTAEDSTVTPTDSTTITSTTSTQTTAEDSTVTPTVSTTNASTTSTQTTTEDSTDTFSNETTTVTSDVSTPFTTSNITIDITTTNDTDSTSYEFTTTPFTISSTISSSTYPSTTIKPNTTTTTDNPLTTTDNPLTTTDNPFTTSDPTIPDTTTISTTSPSTTTTIPSTTTTIPSTTTTIPSTTSTIPSTTTTTTASTTTATTTTATTTTISTTTTPKPIVPPPDCPQDKPFPVQYPNYTWPSAKPGSNTTQKCPPGSDSTNSNATRFCNSNGKWPHPPNLIKCRNLNTDAVLDELNDENSTTTAGDVLDKWATNITNTTMGPGDVISVVNVMDAAKDRHKKDLEKLSGTGEVLNVTSKYTESVTKISSKALENATIWEGLEQEPRFQTGSQLQENVKEAAVEVALLLTEKEQIYDYDSLSVLAQQYSSAHYDDPKNRTFTHSKYTSNNISLPPNFYNNLPNKSRVAISFVAYNTLHCVMSGAAICGTDMESDLVVENLVNSPVIGLTVGNESWNAEGGSKIEVNFANIYNFSSDIYNLTKSQCVWWDSVNQFWSSDGCEVVHGTDTGTSCACDHLTNLAVIMDVNGKLPAKLKEVAYWITIIGCSLSLFCLFLAILTLGVHVRKARDVSGYNTKINLHFCCCLFITEIILLVGLEQTQSKAGCGVVAGLLHYFLLVTFCWMGVESLNLYKLMITVFSTGKSPMRFYYLSAYGCPALIVGISAAATQGRGYGTEEYCWLDYENGLTAAFVAPALIILMFNLIIFGMTIKVFKDQIDSEVQRGTRVGRGKKKENEQTLRWEKEDKKKMVKSTFMVAMTMGITWLPGFIFMFTGAYWLAILFTIINSLHGVALFFALIIFRQKRREELLNIFHIHPKKGSSWHKICYPHGQRSSSTVFTSSTGADTTSTSAYDTRDSSDRWAERVTTASSLSSSQRPHPQEYSGISIDPRRGSGELDIKVAGDIVVLSVEGQRERIWKKAA